MMDLEQIYNLMQIIDSKVDSLLQWKAGMIEMCKSHQEKTKVLNDTVFENPGIKEKVDQLWNSEKQLLNRRAYWLSIVKTIIAALIIMFVCWVLILYKKF